MLQPTKDKVYVTWDEVMQYCKKVAERYRGSITGVYGIPRGGIVFAVIVSHMLNILLLYAPCDGCLVIDDIADTGETLLHYSRRGYDITTMFYNPTFSEVKPDMWMLEKKDRWIVYPWEVQNENS